MWFMSMSGLRWLAPLTPIFADASAESDRSETFERSIFFNGLTGSPKLMSSKKKKRAPALSKKQLRFLRGLAHHVDPLAMIGQHGLTDQVIKSVEDVFHTHELIKVKVQSTATVERPETAARLAQQTGAALVQIIGGMIVLYRPNPDLPSDRTIHLPRPS